MAVFVKYFLLNPAKKWLTNNSVSIIIHLETNKKHRLKGDKKMRTYEEMSRAEIFKNFPNLKKVNEVTVGMSTLEEWENENTYLQIIDDVVMLLEHQNEYLIDNL